MTRKEQAYAIIDGFTEKQVKGFVDLFTEPEPEPDHDAEESEKEAIIGRLAEIYLDGNNDPMIMNKIEEKIQNCLAKGYSKMRAYIYAFDCAVGWKMVYFEYVLKFKKRGYKNEDISELLEIPIKEVEEMVELLKWKKLIEDETDEGTEEILNQEGSRKA